MRIKKRYEIDNIWKKVDELTDEFGISRDAAYAAVEAGRKIGNDEGRDEQLWFDIMSLASKIGFLKSGDFQNIAEHLSLTNLTAEDVEYYLDRRS